MSMHESRTLFLKIVYSDGHITSVEFSFLDGYCSTVQGLLDWFESDLGFTELLFIQIDLRVMFVFVFYSPDLCVIRMHESYVGHDSFIYVTYNTQTTHRTYNTQSYK